MDFEKKINGEKYQFSKGILRNCQELQVLIVKQFLKAEQVQKNGVSPINGASPQSRVCPVREAIPPE